MEQEFVIFFKIMLINVVLSGDNAVVIAMASQKLPPRERRKAVWWGSFGAVAMRVMLTAVAIVLLKIPYIQAVGSLLLFYIAVHLLLDQAAAKKIQPASTLLNAVWTIVVADFIMSLDNVLAIAAVAGDNIALMLVGIGLSIPLIVWGSTMIMKLLDRYPVFVYLGAAVLGYTAGEMIAGDREVGALIQGSFPALHGILPLLGASLVIAVGLYGRLSFRGKTGS